MSQPSDNCLAILKLIKQNPDCINLYKALFVVLPSNQQEILIAIAQYTSIPEQPNVNTVKSLQELLVSSEHHMTKENRQKLIDVIKNCKPSLFPQCLTVGQIADRIGCSHQSTASALLRLKQAGIVNYAKEGREHFYFIKESMNLLKEILMSDEYIIEKA